MPINVSQNFLTYNEQETKNIVLVVKIDGAPNAFSSRKVFKRFRYGMRGMKYGDPSLVYGGLVPDPDILDYIDFTGSSLTIDQSIEPEEGRGSISQLTISFIDFGGYMTRFCAPGVIIPEIQGVGVEVFIGFQEIAWPEDYVKVFRGYVSAVTDSGGKVSLSLSDPNLKTKQEMISLGMSALPGSVTSGATSITVDDTSSFKNYKVPYYGFIDQAVTLYLRSGDEWIERAKTDAGMTSTTFTGLTRGARGTVAEAIDLDAEITEGIEIEDHVIDMALKLMLSGSQNDNFVEGLAVQAFNWDGSSDTLSDENTIIMPDGVDVVSEYGVIIGDVAYISGGANDGAMVYLTGFRDLNGRPNKIIDIEYTLGVGTLTTETSTVATLAFRSKYNTYPLGMGLSPKDVDVEGFERLKSTFLFQPEYAMRFFLTEDITNGKDFLESQLYKPVGAYSLTRGGKLSIGLTKPPLASSELRELSADNIRNPEQIQVKRATNDRKFYNRIDYAYDYNDEGEPTSYLKVLDPESRSLIGLQSVLKVEAPGARSDLQVGAVFQKRAQFLLSRYKRGAQTFPVSVFFKVGVLIEAGDVVAVRDDGDLMLPNVATGERDIGFKLFEVIKRTLNIKDGTASLTLVAGVGAEATDRFGTIAPSSILHADTTQTELVVIPSFAMTGGSNERSKWEMHIGEKLLVHSEDWTVQGECTLVSFDSSDSRKMIVSGLSFIPAAGYIVDVPYYPDTADKNDSREYKTLYAHFSYQLSPVALAPDATHFEVDAGKEDLFHVGSYVRVHNYGFTEDSGDVKVLGKVGSIIVVEDMGFVPGTGHFIDLVGFPDGGVSYRYV